MDKLLLANSLLKDVLGLAFLEDSFQMVDPVSLVSPHTEREANILSTVQNSLVRERGQLSF